VGRVAVAFGARGPRRRPRIGCTTPPTNASWSASGATTSTELVVGRNPVIECLHARVPATALYIAQGTRNDDRLTEAVQLAHSRSIPLIEVPRIELDSMTGNGLHQGVGLQIPPFEYADVFDLIGTVADSKEQGMIVVLDNITDPRNLGAVIRSTAAFGGQGVVIPERRSASVTAVAWRTSAGTAARLPVAKATNITRTLKEFQQNGYQVVGLDAGGDTTYDSYDGTGPVVIVVGSEGKGLSRLVRETCDVLVSVPTTSWVESLNASVAAGVVLSEFSRQRRATGVNHWRDLPVLRRAVGDSMAGRAPVPGRRVDYHLVARVVFAGVSGARQCGQ